MRKYQTYSEVPMWVVDFVCEAENVDSVYSLPLNYIAKIQNEYETYLEEMAAYQDDMNMMEVVI